MVVEKKVDEVVDFKLEGLSTTRPGRVCCFPFGVMKDTTIVVLLHIMMERVYLINNNRAFVLMV